MNTVVLDATDMSCFADDTFDVVLNMGPLILVINVGLSYDNSTSQNECRQ